MCCAAPLRANCASTKHAQPPNCAGTPAPRRAPNSFHELGVYQPFFSSVAHTDSCMLLYAPLPTRLQGCGEAGEQQHAHSGTNQRALTVVGRQPSWEVSPGTAFQAHEHTVWHCVKRLPCKVASRVIAEHSPPCVFRRRAGCATLSTTARPPRRACWAPGLRTGVRWRALRGT